MTDYVNQLEERISYLENELAESQKYMEWIKNRSINKLYFYYFTTVFYKGGGVTSNHVTREKMHNLLNIKEDVEMFANELTSNAKSINDLKIVQLTISARKKNELNSPFQKVLYELRR